MVRFNLALILIVLCLYVSPVDADPPPYLDSIVTVENCGRFTVAPGGGENLHDPEFGNEYRIHITVTYNGDPITTLLATDFWLERSGALAVCTGIFCQADDGTDPSGYTSISGTIHGGLVADGSGGVDCSANELYLYAMGYLLNDSEPVCVTFDSPDLNGDLAVTIADFALFSMDFNCDADCDPCHDYNEDGATTVADFGIFAGYFNASVCP